MPRERWENLLRHPRWWMSPFSLCLKIQISVFSRVLCWRPRSLVWSLLENCGEASGGDITALCPCCWQNTHVHIWDTLANIYMLIKCRGAVCTCSIRSFHHAFVENVAHCWSASAEDGGGSWWRLGGFRTHAGGLSHVPAASALADFKEIIAFFWQKQQKQS